MFVVSAIFTLYDNPPRKTQAEVRVTEPTQAIQANPPSSLTTQPKVQEKAPEPTPAPAPQPKVEAVKEPVVAQITGTKTDWMRAAGIPESQWIYVDYIVGRESGWNPCAYNPGKSDCTTPGFVPRTACGLAQALPCSKIPGDWRDPVNALKWQFGYVTARYGGYAGAYEFWRVHHWY